MTTPGRSTSTRDRIVEAATSEFAEHGIAGARINQIAKVAKTSKERVYAHFRSKEQLYEHVADRELAAVADATDLDPADLPSYAGRLHDYYSAHPDRRRLMRWGSLEFASLDAAATAAAQHKTAVLQKAQREGLLAPDWDPLDILVFVNQLASAWVDQPGLPEPGTSAYIQFLAGRRGAVVAAVERLFPATTGASDTAT